MEGFLYQVVEYLLEHDSDFKNNIVVFPNRRSGTYFMEIFRKKAKSGTWLPKVKTINEFISLYSNLQIATPLAILSELYKTYKHVTQSVETFDQFLPWGEVIINDFDDIDKYLADPKGILTNLVDLKQIERDFDFLSEEQITVIKTFFGSFDPEKKSLLIERFFNIWKFLLPVYVDLNSKLLANKIGYEGMVYRQASENITNPRFEAPAFNKVAFIGFNAITRCEEVIFEKLLARHKALFFWDFDPMYLENTKHEAGWFLRRFVQKFPSPVTFIPSGMTGNKDLQVDLIATPTQTGQLTYINQYLKKVKPEEWTETAIVLADENILPTTLEYFGNTPLEFNITMGYKVKYSLAGQWIDWIIQLHQHTKTDNGQEVSFYYKPVKYLLQHPYFIAIDPTFSDLKIEELSKQNRFFIPKNEFNTSQTGSLIFCEIQTYPQFGKYLTSLLHFILTRLSVLKPVALDWETQTELIYNIILHINQLHNELNQFNISIEMPTYFRLLRQVINNIKVPFEGEPISGIQVMGFLETRNLDFKNVVILNVNEGTLPLNGSTTSFIPYSLRKGFGLPAREDREAIYAYYFYRLLHKTRNLSLLYIDNPQGGAAGDKSRYIMQLLYSPFKINQIVINANIGFSSAKRIEIPKQGLVQQILNDFCRPDSEKCISPSALVTYLTCPLQFYYKHLLKLRTTEQPDETVDARMFGNIFHKTSELIFNDFCLTGQLVTEAYLDSIISDDQKIDNILNKAFSESFNEEGDGMSMNLLGKNAWIFTILKQYIKRMLLYDKQFSPFMLVSLEKKYMAEFTICPGGKTYKVKIGGTIDRIDKTNGAIRIIDYKTGSNDLVCNSLPEVFDPLKIKTLKGMMQNLVYCQVYAINYPDTVTINPYLYIVRDLFKDQIDFRIKIKNEDAFTTGNFKQIQLQVNEQITWLLEEIFDAGTPFIQTKNVKNCEYCDYRFMCERQFSTIPEN